MLAKGISKKKKALTTEQREDLGKTYSSLEISYEKALLNLTTEDVHWLNEITAKLKRPRRKTNKSELVRLGISLLQERDQAEILEALRTFE